MKSHIQKLPLDEGCSFIARTYETPIWETPFHQHDEYELMVIKQGNGTYFFGNNVGEFKEGDVFLGACNVPHRFRKKSRDLFASSMVTQFKEHFLGEDFFNTEEMSSIKRLLKQSLKGIFCKGELRKQIGERLIKLEHLPPFKKVLELLDILYEISQSSEMEFVLKANAYSYSQNDQYLVNLIFEFCMENFKRKVSLEEVAQITSKSVSAFSHYFRKTTKMSFVQFLTQIRISHACSLLKDTDLSVTEICYQSGFHNWSNFSTHFKTINNMSPSAFRKICRQQLQ